MRCIPEIATPRSAYLHIPFCYKRCFYCDFVVVPLGHKASGASGPGSSSVKSYLDLLHREIAASPKGPPLSTVYIGGGTPSLLSPKQIDELLDCLQHHFGFQDGAELTMEMDPHSFDKNSLNEFVNTGINRVSLGGQSFDDKVLEDLGRSHSRQDLLDACDLLHQVQRQRKIRSWSLDLIQNLPNQNLMGWEAQLQQAISTCVPHISVYDLSVETGTVFAWRKKRGELFLPDEDLAADIMNLTSDVLPLAGLKRYEISNYAQPGHASRHNRVYWSGGGWWAFGQGATSSPWGQRFVRPRTINGYKQWVEEQELKGPESSLLKNKNQKINLEEKLFVGLRRREGVSLKEVAQQSGWSHQQCKSHFSALEKRLKDFFERGLIEKFGNRLKLTDPLGMALSNQVFVEILIWWESISSYADQSPSSEELLSKVDDHLLMED